MSEVEDREGGHGLTGPRRERDAPSPVFGFYTLATAALTIALLYWARDVLLPVALAVLLSFLLSPLVARFERWRLGNIPAVILAVALAFAAIGGVGGLVTGQVIELSNRLPEYKDNLLERVRSMSPAKGKFKEASQALEEIGEELAGEGEDVAGEEEAEVESVPPTAEELIAAALLAEEGRWLEAVREEQLGNGSAGSGTAAEKPVAVKIVAMPPSPLRQIREWLGPLVAPLVNAGLVVVLVVFMLIHRRDLRNRVILLFGRSHLRITTEALNDAALRVSRYLRTQLLINACYGAALGVGLYFIGLPNAFLWGVLGMLLRFLPYVGPWLAAAMPLTLSLAIAQGWTQPLMTAGLFVLLELVVNNVLEPWLYGSSTGLSAMGIIVAAIFWTWLWGSVGLVLAVPLTVCLVVAARYVPRLRFVAILFSDHAMLPIQERVYQRLLAFDDDEAETLARDFLKRASLAELYDAALVPALRLAEEDRHAGQLSQPQEQFILQTVRDWSDDFAAEAAQAGAKLVRNGDFTADETVIAEAAPPRGRVLCVPVRDEADQLSAAMLAHLLRSRGFEVQLTGTSTLASELVEQAGDHQADAVVLSIVPPLGGRDGRYLCKRLRTAHPNLPILVGLWDGQTMSHSIERLEGAGASHVVTSLGEALLRLEALRTIFRPAEPAAAPPPQLAPAIP